MFPVWACSCLCAVYWSQVLSREWRCSWSSADRRCSNYIWVINNLIAYYSGSYIRDLMVYIYIYICIYIYTYTYRDVSGNTWMCMLCSPDIAYIHICCEAYGTNFYYIYHLSVQSIFTVLHTIRKRRCLGVLWIVYCDASRHTHHQNSMPSKASMD